jgi:hypothetical protein
LLPRASAAAIAACYVLPTVWSALFSAPGLKGRPAPVAARLAALSGGPARRRITRPVITVS